MTDKYCHERRKQSHLKPLAPSLSQAFRTMQEPSRNLLSFYRGDMHINIYSQNDTPLVFFFFAYCALDTVPSLLHAAYVRLFPWGWPINTPAVSEAQEGLSNVSWDTQLVSGQIGLEASSQIIRDLVPLLKGLNVTHLVSGSQPGLVCHKRGTDHSPQSGKRGHPYCWALLPLEVSTGSNKYPLGIGANSRK